MSLHIKGTKNAKVKAKLKIFIYTLKFDKNVIISIIGDILCCLIC